MEETSTAGRGFVPRLLPLALGAVFLVLYLITLNPWAGANSLEMLARISERDGEILFNSPLLYLVTLPLKWLSTSTLPTAANVLSAVCAALVLVTLARCVAILPHDRTREQRTRGHSEGALLSIPLAWAPPVFAAALLGLQLTFWEQATTLTGEMLDLLVFAFCIRCLLEYRLAMDEKWLWRFAFVYGAGMTNNWALIGFAPLFLMAVVWIRSWSFFNAGFLVKMTLLGLAGMLLYLLIPAVAAAKYGDELTFWGALKSLLTTQKTYLLGIPRGRALLLALVCLLPLFLMGVRWGGQKGSSMETLLNITAVVVLQVGWLATNVYFAFDPAFSPRRMVHLDAAGGGLPLLTFHFTGALASGYFLGYLLLLGSAKSSKTWDQPGPLVGGLIKLGFGAAVLGTLAVPVGLVVKNLTAIRTNNGPVLRELAASLTQSLPKEPSLVVADDAVTYGLVALEQAGNASAPDHLLIHTTRGPRATYRRTLAARHGATWPELKQMEEAEENVAGQFLSLLTRAATNGRAFYLHPSYSFAAEKVWPTPRGGVYALSPYRLGQLTPTRLTEEAAEAALRWWAAAQPAMDRARTAAELGTLNGKVAVTVWSRSANAVGVMFQQAGRLEEAKKFFETAVRLKPRNAAAQVNLAMNAALQAKQPLGDDARKPLIGQRPMDFIGENGPVDEPYFLSAVGQALVGSPEGLVRRAAIAFQRAVELDPEFTPAAISFVDACLVAGENALALKSVQELQARKLEPAERVQVDYLEAATLFRLQRDAEAEQVAKAALVRNPQATEFMDLLSYFYLGVNRPDDAVPVLEQWQRVRPSDPAPFLRLAALLMGRQQHERALAMLDTALKSSPESVAALANRAICLLQLNRLDEARRAYEELDRKVPDQHIFAYGLAQIAERKKDSREALQQFERYLALAPTNTAEYTNVVLRVTQLKQGP
jgi:tetratricopeptide (TPR) repeat protein